MGPDEPQRYLDSDLGQSRDLLAEVQELVQFGFWRWDIGAGEVWWSDQVYRIYGVDQRAFTVTFEAFLAAVHEDDRLEMSTRIDAALAGSEEHDVRHRVVRPDGEVRYVRERGRVIRDPGGFPVGMLGTVLDVTEDTLLRIDRDRALEALSQEEAKYRLLAENAYDVIWTMGIDGAITYVSPSVERVRGITPAEAAAQTLDQIHPPGSAAKVGEYFARLYAAIGAGEVPPLYQGEHEYYRKDGSIMLGALQVIPQVDAEGRVVQILGVTRDISAQRADEDALSIARDEAKASEEKFRLLAENASDLVILHDIPGTMQWVSPSVFDVLGWDPEDWQGHSISDFIYPEDLARNRHARETAVAAGADGGHVRLRFAVRGGGWRWMDITARLLRDDNNRPIGAVESLRDVQLEVETQHALAQSEQRFRLAMTSAPVGMAIVDLDRRFVQVNPALCRMLGRDEEWLLSHRIPDILGPDPMLDDEDLKVRTHLLTGQTDSSVWDHSIVTAAGEQLVVTHASAIQRDEQGTPVSFVSQFVDITETRKAQDRLRFLATHDDMTSLANRPELLQTLAKVLTRTPRSGTRNGVLFLDLDDFKVINDTHGHAIGDHVLIECADRIRSQVRSQDVAARIGGDEFVVMLTGLHSQADAEDVAAKIRRAVAKPIEVEGRILTTSVSVGLALAKPGDTPDDLLARADFALYRAKREGRNRTASHE